MLFRVFTEGKILECSAKDVETFLSRKDSYFLWINLENLEALEKNRGDLKLFQKRILGRLLCFFIIHPNMKFSAAELFEAVWLADYDDFCDFGTIKTNVSRLRTLLGDPPPDFHYIKKTPSTFLGSSGRYYFNTESSYCLIQPKGITLF